MILGLGITNHVNKSLYVDLFKPWVTGLAVIDVDGVGPENADITVTEVATLNGGFYNYGRIPSREITIKIRFYEHDNVDCEKIRHLTYEYFPLNTKVRLTFKTDSRMCSIEGIVKANTPNIFSNKEGTSIKVICPDPYFYEVEDIYGSKSKQTATTFNLLDKVFEFNFENSYGVSMDGGVQKMSNIIFGEIKSKDVKAEVYYEGDGEDGVLISAHARGDISRIIINNLTTSEHMQIEYPLKTGHTMDICTIRGQKRCQVFDANDIYVDNAMPYITNDSNWFTLARGKNAFSYKAFVKRKNDLGIEETIDVTEDISLTIFNRIKYEGI